MRRNITAGGRFAFGSAFSKEMQSNKSATVVAFFYYLSFPLTDKSGSGSLNNKSPA
jgi:hypothetical protein